MYIYTSPRKNGINMTDVNNVALELGITAERVASKVNGVSRNVVRTEVVQKYANLQAACETDQCGPTGSFGETVRVITSGVDSSAVRIVQAIRQIADFYEANPHMLAQGIPPNPAFTLESFKTAPELP